MLRAWPELPEGWMGVDEEEEGKLSSRSSEESCFLTAPPPQTPNLFKLVISLCLPLTRIAGGLFLRIF